MPFSSVLQVLFIILESKPPYLHREVTEESLYQIWRGTQPPLELKNEKFSTPPTVKLDFNPGSHIFYIKGVPMMPLLESSWYRQL